MSSNRTDAHAPSNLVTEDYSFCFGYDNNPSDDQPRQPLSAWARGILDAVQATERGTWQCHHCGARMRYAAILRHLPTDTYIAVGETCLDNRFDRATADFHAMRKNAQLDRQAQRIRGLVAAFCEANADLAWMGEKGAPGIPATSADNGFVRDIARKLHQYGELSPRQVDAVRAAIVRDAERAAQRAAERAAEAELPVIDCPTGRVTVTGVVVGTKVQYSDFGAVKKLIIRDERGFKVWVTEPSSIHAERGDTVRLTCNITRSDRDASFGFGKRPTKPEVLATAQGDEPTA